MNLPNLQEFYCCDNQLTSLPLCILNFGNLQSFSYHNNMIVMSQQIAHLINKIDSINELNIIKSNSLWLTQ
jgi:hypothetical protein